MRGMKSLLLSAEKHAQFCYAHRVSIGKSLCTYASRGKEKQLRKEVTLEYVAIELIFTFDAC